jgi:hypothetical protein
VLHANDAVAVDDEGLRDAIDAEVEADAAVLVEERRVVGIAEARQPRARVGAGVLVVESVDRHDALLRELEQQRVLFAAGDAPRGPDVEDERLALEVFEAHGLGGVVEPGEGELRRRLVDQRRGHFPRVALQADGEDDRQRQEGAERDQEPEPLHAVAAAYAGAACRTLAR